MFVTGFTAIPSIPILFERMDGNFLAGVLVYVHPATYGRSVKACTASTKLPAAQQLLTILLQGFTAIPCGGPRDGNISSRWLPQRAALGQSSTEQAGN